MNIYKYLIAACLALFLFSCDEDENIYVYDEHEVITVTGIESDYNLTAYVDRLVLDPEISSSKPGATFEYFWAVYETNVQGYAPTLDTIATTKELDYMIDLTPKGWVLVFGAKNTQTGYQQVVTSNLNISTMFTRGWYVLKDDGSNTDVDLFSTPTSIIPEERFDNVFSQVNGRKLAGTARFMALFTNYRTFVTGMNANTRVLTFASSQDASVTELATLGVTNDFDGMFYDAPAVRAPTGFTTALTQAMYVMNDGKVHLIYTMAANVGKFGAPMMINPQNSPYRLSPFFITELIDGPTMFDEISSSFVKVPTSGNNFIRFTDAATTQVPANNNNLTCIYMGQKVPMPSRGFGVFQDKSNPATRMILEIVPTPTAFSAIQDVLSPEEKAYNASMYTLLNGDENLMYFVVGNEIWSRNLSNRFEQLQYTLPAGEQVTFIRHRKYTESGYAHNYVMIGTHSGGNYKVRMFEKTAGNLHANPVFTLEGQGRVGDVMYVSPRVSNTTFPYTY
jgi:hypothetical protein